MDRPPRQAVRALLVHEGQVLLARSFDRHDLARSWWELPGGGIEAGETAVEALVRELREETGYVDVEVGQQRWHWTTEWVFSDREVLQHDRVHVARLRSPRRVAPTPLEHEGLAGVHWVPVGLVGELRAPVVPVTLTALLDEADDGDAASRELSMPPRVPWPMANGAQVLVRLWAEPGSHDQLRGAQDHLLRLALEHRGEVVTRVRPMVLDVLAADEPHELPDEVQVLRFPGPLELDAFLADPRRAAGAVGLGRTEVVPVGSLATPRG